MSRPGRATSKRTSQTVVLLLILGLLAQLLHVHHHARPDVRAEVSGCGHGHEHEAGEHHGHDGEGDPSPRPCEEGDGRDCLICLQLAATDDAGGAVVGYEPATLVFVGASPAAADLPSSPYVLGPPARGPPHLRA